MSNQSNRDSWRDRFDNATLAKVDALSDEQKDAAAALYSAKSQMYSSSITPDQARQTLDSWPVYYLSWLKKLDQESVDDQD